MVAMHRQLEVQQLVVAEDCRVSLCHRHHGASCTGHAATPQASPQQLRCKHLGSTSPLVPLAALIQLEG